MFFRQKSRRLKAPKLFPKQLELTGGYLAVPNQLLNCAQYGLKPAHLAILLYLLAKPPATEASDPWKVDYKHMSDQLGIGETYAPKYVTFLREKGFLTFNRNDRGETEWVILLPEFAAKKSEPHRENIHGENIHGENVAPLIINKVLEKNEETTNETVVVSLPDYVNNGAVKQELSALELKTQQLVLAVLAAAMTSGKVKSPIAYAMGLIKKAKDGLLSAPVVDNTVVKAVDKRKLDFIRRNYDRLKKQLTGVERINIAHPTYDGWIYGKDLEEFENVRV